MFSQFLSLSDKILSSLSFVALIVLWQVLALIINDNTLPSPALVLQALWQELQSGQLPYHLGITLLRLLISFAIAMSLGCVLGVLLGSNKKLDDFFDNWLVIFLNIPALVIIILCYVWFGLLESAAILAVVINKLPNIIVTIREGTKAMNKDLLEMARCYCFSQKKIFIHVLWPQLHPFVMAATRSGLALIWKIILVVELLGRTNGMGYQIHLFFQLFDVANILAYTIAFLVVIQSIELLVLKPLDNKATRWQR